MPKNEELFIEIANSKLILSLIDENGDYTFDKTLELPLNIVKNGRIIDENQLFYLIKKSLEESDIHFKDVILVVESSDILVRKHIVPNLDNIELEELLSLEIAEIFPFDLEPYTYNYDVIKETEENLELFIYLVPLTIFDSYKKLFSDLDMNMRKLRNKSRLYYDFGQELKLARFGVLELANDLFAVNVFSDDHYYKGLEIEDLNSYVENENIEYSHLDKIIEKEYVDIDNEELLNSCELNYYTFIKEHLKGIENIINDFSIEEIFIYGDLVGENTKDFIEKNYFNDHKLHFVNRRVFKYNFWKKSSPKLRQRVVFSETIDKAGVPILISILVLLIIGNIVYINKTRKELEALNTQVAQETNRETELYHELNEVTELQQEVDNIPMYIEDSEETKSWTSLITFLEDKNEEGLIFDRYELAGEELQVHGRHNDINKMNNLERELQSRANYIYTLEDAGPEGDYSKFILKFYSNE